MNGMKQKFITPEHPTINRLAEHNVQTLKDRLKSISLENLTIHLKIQKIPFLYQATPLANGKSRAEMYLNHRISRKLDAMFLYYERKSEQKSHSKTA